MIKLELSEQMMAVIAQALGNHPYREAAPVIAEIQRQYNQRMQAGPPLNGGQQPDMNRDQPLS